MLERKAIYSIEEVYNKVCSQLMATRSKPKVDFDGDLIKANSQRLQVFFTKGMTCMYCGVRGSFFAKERTKGTQDAYHLNLYGILPNGEEVLMTKDHIIPKSKGGRNCLENYQCMCSRCNEMKGNS